jgi:hypothetical protein
MPSAASQSVIADSPMKWLTATKAMMPLTNTGGIDKNLARLG